MKVSGHGRIAVPQTASHSVVYQACSDATGHLVNVCATEQLAKALRLYRTRLTVLVHPQLPLGGLLWDGIV